MADLNTPIKIDAENEITKPYFTSECLSFEDAGQLHQIKPLGVMSQRQIQSSFQSSTDPMEQWELEEITTKRPAARQLDTQSGKIGWAILWLLGVPLPLLLIAYLIWGR